uniref:Mitochondrial assembly of ribosomal large subunit protein 1 n=1 Tax=Glossina brevipalpis TaxID=37001 RepID=A0A1A9WEC1_9MUSC
MNLQQNLWKLIQSKRLSLQSFRLIRDKNLFATTVKYFHCKSTDEISLNETKKISKSKKSEYISSKLQKESKQEDTSSNVAGSIQQKYKTFREEEFSEIFDVEEERQHQKEQRIQDVQNVQDECLELNLESTWGIRGVYDVDSLVEVLRKEGAEDIFVCSVPKQLKYVDYFVVCSGRSRRHIMAIAEFVRFVYKKVRNVDDIIPKIEGKGDNDWMALDLGNIALHVLSPKIRKSYDLESLWAVGVEYDREFNKPQDPLVELFEKKSILLADIKNNL